MAKAKFLLGVDAGISSIKTAVVRTHDQSSYGVIQIPAFVAYGEKQIFIGQAAQRYRNRLAKTAVWGNGRVLGKTWQSMQEDHIVAPMTWDDNIIKYKIFNRLVYPEEILARLLRNAKEETEEHANCRFESATISVPNSYDHSQRKATLEAARIAGIAVHRLINKTTAAVLALAHRRQFAEKKYILVYHLGSSSFDLALYEVDDASVKMKYSFSDTTFGGHKITECTLRWLLDYLKENNNVDENRMENRELGLLRDNIEEAVKQLMHSSESFIFVPKINDYIVLERDVFNTFISESMQKTFIHMKDCMRKFNLEPSDVEELVLMGSPSQMLLTNKPLSSGFKIVQAVHADSWVAEGAAILGLGRYDVVETIGTSLNYCIPDSQKKTMMILSETTKVPVKTEVLYNHGTINVLRGDQFVDSYSIEALTKLARITFSFDKNCVLTVSAIEVDTNSVLSVTKNEAIDLSGMSLKQDESELAKHHQELVDIIEYYKSIITLLDVDVKYKEIYQNLCDEDWIRDPALCTDITMITRKRNIIETFYNFILKSNEDCQQLP